MIYHLVRAETWAARPSDGYRAASLESEGFIHCSSREQVPRSAAKYYAGVSDLCVLMLDESALKAPLVWENTSGGSEPFPHIYGAINLDAVVQVVALAADQRDWDFQVLDRWS